MLVRSLTITTVFRGVKQRTVGVGGSSIPLNQIDRAAALHRTRVALTKKRIA